MMTSPFDTINDILLNNVRYLCRQKGIAMKDVAAKMNMAPESLSRAIHGNPTLSTLCSLANTLEVPLSRLFDVDDVKDYKDFIGVISNGSGGMKVVKSVKDFEKFLSDIKKIELSIPDA